MPRLVITLLLSLHLLLPIVVWAQVRTKDPLDYPLKTYALILGIALLGGVVSWYSKVRKGEIPLWSINHLVGEMATSALAGLLVWWLCEWAGYAPLFNAAMAGMAGHMGARAITLLEEWGTRRFASDKGMRP